MPSSAPTSSPAATAAAAPAALAKGALRRLARAQQEPTPENYARAYAEEAGTPLPASAAAAADAAPPGAAAPADAADARTAGNAWATLVERLARNLERGGRQWTAARRKESLKRVLDGSRSDAARLLQRLQSLMAAWEADQPSDPALTGAEDPPLPPGVAEAAAVAAVAPAAAPAGDWLPLATALGDSVRAALPQPQAADLAAQLGRLADAVAAEGATPPRVAEIEDVCRQAQRLFAQRHRLVDELAALCRELTAGMTELAEEDSWARGQCVALQARLDEDATSVRAVRAAGALLAETRQRQHAVRSERAAARESLRQLIQGMLQEVGELGAHTGRFQLATAQHAEAIAAADTLEGLAGVVKALLDDARAVQTAVAAANGRLQADSARASALEDKVRALEAELLRLSEEVSTDALTQVANRRGLMQAFEAESARALRQAESQAAGPLLAVGLIDIDNFKKLNDTLGHAAGDRALQALAAAVVERLRPGDHLARFGGEEFVVLLPETGVDEAQQTLTRLQRSLTEALFLHEGQHVFVTFSAGVTAWRAGEPLQPAIERADEALYEAKRSGKNRTCMA